MRTGSHGKILVRGQHEKEALWLGAGVMTPLTSMSGERAARQLVEACVAGQPHVTPGLQFRLAEIAEVVDAGPDRGREGAGRRAPAAGPERHCRGTAAAHHRPTSASARVTPFLPHAAAAANNELGGP